MRIYLQAVLFLDLAYLHYKTHYRYTYALITVTFFLLLNIFPLCGNSSNLRGRPLIKINFNGTVYIYTLHNTNFRCFFTSVN